MIFQFAGDFFSDSTHHVGFPLSPFTNTWLSSAYCSLRNEMERNEMKRNEMERNEMKICSLRNENL